MSIANNLVKSVDIRRTCEFRLNASKFVEREIAEFFVQLATDRLREIDIEVPNSLLNSLGTGHLRVRSRRQHWQYEIKSSRSANRKVE